jgi:hypothetical protein
MMVPSPVLVFPTLDGVVHEAFALRLHVCQRDEIIFGSISSADRAREPECRTLLAATRPVVFDKGLGGVRRLEYMREDTGERTF